MKKVKFLISALIITFMFACSHEEDNSSVIEQLKLEKDLQTKRVIYNFLSKEEKSKIWTDRLDELLADKDLTTEQSNILGIVKNYVIKIHSSEYLENEKLYLERNKEDKVLIEKCLVLFSKEYVYNNFYTLEPIILSDNQFVFRDNVPVIEPGPGGGSNDCDCLLDTLFNCGILSVSNCQKTRCQKRDDGCGFVLQYPCDGKCFSFLKVRD